MVHRITRQSIERVTQELEFHDGGFILSRSADSDSISSVPQMRRFSFELCRKASQFGDVLVDHFWMDHATVYGQRNCSARNHDAIVEGFWGLCWREGSVLEDPIQESYILAKLVPQARSNGSRRVFEDAVTTRSTVTRRQRLVRDLERRLVASRSNELSMVSFRDQTAAFLGPPSYPDEVWQRYRVYEQELLGEGRAALERGDGIEVALTRWRNWMNGLARRRGNSLDKQVLDIFSYECRAALHRCYSAVWAEMLPILAERYDFAVETSSFHRLWHLEQSTPSDDPHCNFHLFHGHIFGLHPGSNLFAQTRTGGELIGESLMNPGGEPAFGRLLNGLMIAMYEYADRCGTNRERRRSSAEQWNNALDDTLKYDPDFDEDE